mmetsp:Transcript_15028/g.33084  ORF Transcript_15028/g.33084 Transcript_15028/m.33084 type:complete len:201 (+) Transcript_15028:189-791(+)
MRPAAQALEASDQRPSREPASHAVALLASSRAASSPGVSPAERSAASIRPSSFSVQVELPGGSQVSASGVSVAISSRFSTTPSRSFEESFGSSPSFVAAAGDWSKEGFRPASLSQALGSCCRSGSPGVAPSGHVDDLARRKSAVIASHISLSRSISSRRAEAAVVSGSAEMAEGSEGGSGGPLLSSALSFWRSAPAAVAD